jgi:hypothetical protein
MYLRLELQLPFSLHGCHVEEPHAEDHEDSERRSGL